MPRALTEKEKCRQCRKLIEKGREVVFAQGIKKVSVEEIAKAAGMAKGLFYRHFGSKEEYLYELIWDIHMQFFEKASQMIQKHRNLQENIRELLMDIFHMPEMEFFANNHDETMEIFEIMSEKNEGSENHREKDMYEKLLIMAGIDIDRVNPGVVHNYFHAVYLVMSSDLMIKEALPETFDRMLDGLISYIFGGAE